MRFTAYQYDEAIKRLQDAKQQLEQEANPCSVCGDSGHLAYECGFNPLVAVELCKSIADQSEKLHQTLHLLAGYDQAFGVQLGPKKVIIPPRDEASDPNIGQMAMPIYPDTLEQLTNKGRALVRAYGLDKRYPQPELDREAFVRQVKGSLPPYLWPFVDLDPFGIACGFPLNGDNVPEFLFPNLTGLGMSDYEQNTDGILEAAKHRIKLDIPKAGYPILIDYIARGGPGKPANWWPDEYYVSGLEYRTKELAVAVALSTGDYPEKEAK